MTASTEGARRAPFLPEAASKFLRRRSIQLSGLCLLAFAVFLFRNKGPFREMEG